MSPLWPVFISHVWKEEGIDGHSLGDILLTLQWEQRSLSVTLLEPVVHWRGEGRSREKRREEEGGRGRREEEGGERREYRKGLLNPSTKNETSLLMTKLYLCVSHKSWSGTHTPQSAGRTCQGGGRVAGVRDRTLRTSSALHPQECSRT